MSWKCAQVASIPAGTVKVWFSSTARSRPGGREHRAAGEDGGEVPAVVRVAVEVRGRVGAVGRRGSRRADRLVGGRLTDQGVLDRAGAQWDRAHVGQPDAGLA